MTMSGAATGGYVLTDVVARLRRVLRTSIRADYPWESLPMAQVELLQSLAESAPARGGDLGGERRVPVVALSEAGARQLGEWNAAHQRRIAGALADLEPAERAAIGGALPAL